ncbi:MAG: zinc-binding alcohol dehydrogenase [Planctomycetes bacterium]|nr:zinc-binding alcohol dehydrogenase [Planctomycetota bacterium]
MPREIVAWGPEKLEIRDYNLPRLEPDGIRVRSTHGAAKHGTETAFLRGYGGRRGRFDGEMKVFTHEAAGGRGGPSRVGNMFVGTVTETGTEAAGFSEGDVVLGYGPFIEIQTVRAAGCRKMPAGLSWKSAVCLDPADFAMGAVRDGNVRVGDAVGVFGLGAIGLMAVQIAKLSGARPVIALDPLPNRRAAASACGADAVLDPAACDAGLEIKKATGGRGADAVIEFSGNVHALQAALRGVAFGGSVVAGAFPPPYPAGLDFGAEAHMNRPNIVFSRACSDPNRDHPRWTEARIYDTCWRLLCDGRLSGEHVVSPVAAFEDVPREYSKIVTDPASNIKLGVEF